MFDEEKGMDSADSRNQQSPYSNDRYMNEDSNGEVNNSEEYCDKVQFDPDIALYKEEQERLKTRLANLHHMVEASQKKSAVLRMKAAVTLGNLQIQAESLVEDKAILEEKYRGLEAKSYYLRTEQEKKQQEFSSLQDEYLSRIKKSHKGSDELSV